MNYLQKYEKYKKKYLELKNMVGGEIEVAIRDGSNSISINGTRAQHFDEIIDFLRKKIVGIPINGGYKPEIGGHFLINFRNNREANLWKNQVIEAMRSFPKYKKKDVVSVRVTPNIESYYSDHPRHVILYTKYKTIDNFESNGIVTDVNYNDDIVKYEICCGAAGASFQYNVFTNISEDNIAILNNPRGEEKILIEHMLKNM